MTDPWCWYINANMTGVFVDIHGAPYIAAPLGSVMGNDRIVSSMAFPEKKSVFAQRYTGIAGCKSSACDSAWTHPKRGWRWCTYFRVSEEKPSKTLKSLEGVEADYGDYGRFRCASMCFKWIQWKATHVLPAKITQHGIHRGVAFRQIRCSVKSGRSSRHCKDCLCVC